MRGRILSFRGVQIYLFFRSRFHPYELIYKDSIFTLWAHDELIRRDRSVTQKERHLMIKLLSAFSPFSPFPVCRHQSIITNVLNSTSCSLLTCCHKTPNLFINFLPIRVVTKTRDNERPSFNFLAAGRNIYFREFSTSLWTYIRQ